MNFWGKNTVWAQKRNVNSLHLLEALTNWARMDGRSMDKICYNILLDLPFDNDRGHVVPYGVGNFYGGVKGQLNLIWAYDVIYFSLV